MDYVDATNQTTATEPLSSGFSSPVDWALSTPLPESSSPTRLRESIKPEGSYFGAIEKGKPMTSTELEKPLTELDVNRVNDDTFHRQPPAYHRELSDPNIVLSTQSKVAAEFARTRRGFPTSPGTPCPNLTEHWDNQTPFSSKKAATTPPQRRVDETGSPLPLLQNDYVKLESADRQSLTRLQQDSSCYVPPAKHSQTARSEGSTTTFEQPTQSAPPTYASAAAAAAKTAGSSATGAQIAQSDLADVPTLMAKPPTRFWKNGKIASSQGARRSYTSDKCYGSSIYAPSAKITSKEADCQKTGRVHLMSSPPRPVRQLFSPPKRVRRYSGSSREAGLGMNRVPRPMDDNEVEEIRELSPHVTRWRGRGPKRPGDEFITPEDEGVIDKMETESTKG